MPSSAARRIYTESELRHGYELRRANRTWAQVHAALAGANPAAVAAGIDRRQTQHVVWHWAIRNGLEAPRTHRARGGRVASATSNLTFGVEIEFRRPTDDRGYALDESVIVAAVQAAGVSCEREDYDHRTRPHWKLIYDGSSDKELVSPVLSGADGMEQVRKVMEVLRTLGCRVTRSEGTHVHIGARDFSPAQVSWLIGAYTANSAVFDGLLARTRRPGGSGYRWCAHLSSREVRTIDADANAGVVSRCMSGERRYRSINLDAYHRHGTVEFRQHQGTLNGTKITAWVALLQAFVTYVTATDTVPTWTSFEDMAVAINLDARTVRYFNRRAAALLEV